MTGHTVTFRDRSSQAAIVFLHGFTGKATTTWGEFPELLLGDPSLASWDVFSLGYPSAFVLDVPGIWSADPDLSVLSKGLMTTLALPLLANRKALVIVAHSMGGLIAQRALLDDDGLARRVQHLFLFGTPSGGLVKASFGTLFKR